MIFTFCCNLHCNKEQRNQKQMAASSSLEEQDVDVADEERDKLPEKEEKEALALQKQMAASSSLEEQDVDVADEERDKLPGKEEEEALALQKQMAASLEEQ